MNREKAISISYEWGQLEEVEEALDTMTHDDGITKPYCEVSAVRLDTGLKLGRTGEFMIPTSARKDVFKAVQKALENRREDLISELEVHMGE